MTILYNAAVVNEQLGDRERALEWLTEALRQGYSLEDVERSRSLEELTALAMKPEFIRQLDGITVEEFKVLWGRWWKINHAKFK